MIDHFCFSNLIFLWICYLVYSFVWLSGLSLHFVDIFNGLFIPRLTAFFFGLSCSFSSLVEYFFVVFVFLYCGLVLLLAFVADYFFSFYFVYSSGPFTSFLLPSIPSVRIRSSSLRFHFSRFSFALLLISFADANLCFVVDSLHFSSTFVLWSTHITTHRRNFSIVDFISFLIWLADPLLLLSFLVFADSSSHLSSLRHFLSWLPSCTRSPFQLLILQKSPNNSKQNCADWCHFTLPTLCPKPPLLDSSTPPVKNETTCLPTSCRSKNDRVSLFVPHFYINTTFYSKELQTTQPASSVLPSPLFFISGLISIGGTSMPSVAKMVSMNLLKSAKSILSKSFCSSLE